MVILGLVLFSALCILAGAGSILRLVFPVGSFAVGVLLYWRYPVLYIGFTLWIWFLTPLVARLVDYRIGWDAQRLMLVSPFLVTLVTLATFLRHLPKSYRQGGLPFVLACTGVFYGFLVGLIKLSFITAARGTLDWLTPILFGFHLFVNWRDYPTYRQNIQRTFLWGVLVTGVYGVLQYLVAPEWDRFWLIESGMTSSAGSPEPLGIRVWSTMHAPGPFAVVMMAGLVLLFSSQEALRIPASAAGYLAFLLTSVRSAWAGWLVGFLILLSSVKSSIQMRLIITILMMAVCIFPLTTIAPFSETINSRFQSFSNLEDDSSAKARTANYDSNLALALSKGLGNGIGGTWTVNEDGKIEGVVIDSGILEMFYTLGWFGAIPYLAGIFLILFNLFQGSESRFDSFSSAARAISLGMFVQIALGSVMLSLSGVVFWSFLGMGMAARKYYQHQPTAQLKKGLS